MLDAPRGVTAKYFGDPGGATARYYWVQAMYPSGNSAMQPAAAVTTPAALSFNNRVMVAWQPAPGAIGYTVVTSTTNAIPAAGAVVAFVGSAETAFTDTGATPTTATMKYPGIFVARARYSFATDGGVSGAITPADSDLIPDGAIVFSGLANSTTAVTSGGSATVAIGTSAGSGAATVLAATAKATLSIDAVVPAAAVIAAPFKMTAAGRINITVATADLTAGIIEIFVFYVLPASQ